MLKDLFSKKKYAPINAPNQQTKKNVAPSNTVKPTPVTSEKVEKLKGLGARDRIKELADENTFIEYDAELKTTDPLNFPNYTEKVISAMSSTHENEVVITGEAKIQGEPCILCVMDPNFIMGSMGSVVGEKITRAIEKAIESKLPVIIFCASGGARMQEGILSLMQMAKTSAALARLSEEGLLYISVLTNPTTGGVTASFAMLGDIILAEPGALIGFAGPRVIEQTIRQKLPEGFQKSEFLQAKGFVDKIVDRKDMRNVLSKILKIHAVGGEEIDA
ncbi:acetyl-CoA carboxylase, carboxyltransferase subunit beta [Clostridium formicaceticum]|uniref:Acetyl-coenzyme A carboxylase carboxyl transferase subunit beta n=1 Tax=Clostridium formicaceticum TaxID=1497 RepID=A0AAC9RMH4_9CLOT|nr:acetyl-CoA carboxylase, carboxyltransferase subunit beta [Clostridium formicaceticum]AOY77494.1 acetyl-CoA carboxylase subunit beta [Clostridium formicaceticum]ARE88060.1 Acetyl-coenzyme A carboxylase carboxyl transferase subunit beta [Clostridium formicaceticum]